MGFSFDSATKVCIGCPLGSYKPEKGNDATCTKCPDGNTTAYVNSTSITDCSIRKYLCSGKGGITSLGRIKGSNYLLSLPCQRSCELLPCSHSYCPHGCPYSNISTTMTLFSYHSAGQYKGLT